MSTLRRQEPVGLGLRRIACTQVEAAIRCLTRQPGQAPSAADNILGAQAALALLAPDLPRLTGRRDQDVMARLCEGLNELTRPEAMLSRLEARYKKTPSDKALASAVKLLRKKWSASSGLELALSSRDGSFNPMIYRLVADMAELRGNIGHWPIDRVSNDLPPRGLRRVYAHAKTLADQPITREGLAQLAPQLALLDRQLTLISKACPSMIKPQRKLLARAVDELADLQGDDALDSVIRKTIGKDSSASLPRAESLAKRTAAILTPDVTNALAESPGAFIKRITVYWSAWRADEPAAK